MGIHCIDLVEYILGSKTVMTCGFNDTRTFGYNVDDSSNILIKLENGAVAYIDSHFNIPDDAAFCRLEFYGTGGSILCEGTIGQVEGGEVKAVLSNAGEYDAQQERSSSHVVRVEAELGNMYTKEIESFGRSILNGDPLEVPLEDVIHVQKVVECSYISSSSGKYVEIL